MSTTADNPSGRVEERLSVLEQQVDQLQEERDDLQERVDELEDAKKDLEKQNEILKSRADGLNNHVSDNDRALAELQSRELEKGAHLQADRVDRRVDHLDIDGDHLECFAGDDGQEYYRLPGEADPLSRSGTSKLAQGDLLPIQQLARMDDDMLRSAGPLPTRLAAKAWSERENGRLWNKGSGEVRQYVDAGDLKVWIHREENGISDEYAKKLASRTIGALQDLTKNRLAIKKRNHKKDGLRYKERRVVLKKDAEIPGETESGGK